jgi:hypothetical protein
MIQFVRTEERVKLKNYGGADLDEESMTRAFGPADEDGSWSFKDENSQRICRVSPPKEFDIWTVWSPDYYTRARLVEFLDFSTK